MLKIVLIFCIKNATSKVNSVCYSFNGEYVVDLPSRLGYESIYVLQNDKSLYLPPKISIQLLLLLSGDIEQCPGPQNGTFDAYMKDITDCK
jgi:hypothetical protein